MSLRPTFLGFETMRKSIGAAQKAMDITGNNIANANSLGYSRQRLDLVSIANQAGGLGYKTSIGLAGQGVNALGVTQLRDDFLDKRYRELNADSAESSTKVDILTDLQNVLDVIDTEGFIAAYTNFKDAITKFATDSTDRIELANIVLTNAQQVVQTLHSYDTKLIQIQEQTKFELNTSVTRVNDILKQISDLNKQIADEYVASGDIFIDGNNYSVNSMYGPNELKDTRNTLLDELSSYGNLFVSENDNGSINVQFAGVEVVSDREYQQMVLDENTSGTLSLHFETDAGIKTPISINANSLSSGALKGYLDMYNGAGVYAGDPALGIPTVQAKADELNDLLATMVNMNATARSALLTQLQEFDGSIAVDAATGAVTMGGVTLLTASGSNSAVNKVVAKTNDDNSGLAFFAGDEELTLTTGSIADTDAEVKSQLSTFSSENGIVYYRKMMDALANTFAAAYNEAANNKDSASTAPGTWWNMFTSSDGGPITAASIKISDVWQADASMIVKEAQYKDASDPSKGVTYFLPDKTELWAGYANKLQIVATKDYGFSIDDSGVAGRTVDETCTIDQYISYWTNKLGQQLQYEESVNTAANTMAETVASSRDAIMGVDLNEEASNMLMFQKWFNASSRMMTAMDEALDVIINSMGLVGR